MKRTLALFMLIFSYNQSIAEPFFSRNDDLSWRSEQRADFFVRWVQTAYAFRGAHPDHASFVESAIPGLNRQLHNIRIESRTLGGAMVQIDEYSLNRARQSWELIVSDRPEQLFYDNDKAEAFEAVLEFGWEQGLIDPNISKDVARVLFSQQALIIKYTPIFKNVLGSGFYSDDKCHWPFWP